MGDRHLTMNQIASAFGISREQVEDIQRNELGMSNVSARWVPRLLTPDQKLTRLTLSEANMAIFEAGQGSFLAVFSLRVGAGSNTLSHRPKGKRQSIQWKHPGTPLQRMQRSSLHQG